MSRTEVNALFCTLLVTPFILNQGDATSSRNGEPLLPGHRTEREMNGADVHWYQIAFAVGQFIHVTVDQRGIDVTLTAFRPDGRKQAEIDSPNGSRGPESLSFAADTSGIYQFEVRSLDSNALGGRYEIGIDELLTAQEYQARLTEEKERDEAVTAWLRNAAVPLGSLTPGSDLNDLGRLQNILKDVRVVGIGEATHGTREFFLLRHRLLEFLVTRMGFTVLAVEASAAAAMDINDYVMYGKGRRAAVLANQQSWILDTEEVDGVLDWLRNYNSKASLNKRVRFIGIDPQGNQTAIDGILGYLRKVAADRADRVEATLRALRAEDQKATNFETTEVSAADLAEVYKLISYMFLNEASFVRSTSTGEFVRVLQDLLHLAQFAEFNSSAPVDGGGTRDHYMAENLQHAVNAENPATRFIVWAHNAHVSTRGTGSIPAMGSYLRRTFGNAYYAFGFAFNQGAFQAQVSGEPSVRVRDFTLGPAPERTIDWYLARAEIGNFLVDCRNASPNLRVMQWLNTSHRMHWIGAIFSDKWTEGRWTQPFVLSRDFDGLFFVERTTPARPTPTGRRHND